MSLLHSAIRSLVRSPRLSLSAVACIGLGAAAVASVSTLVGATLLRPLPFPDAHRLARLWLADDNDPRVSLSIPELREVEGLRSFDLVLGTARVRPVAVLEQGAVRLRGEAVTPGYFEALAVRALHGRLLEAADHRAEAPRVAVLSHGSWVNLYGSDPGVVGRAMRTDRSTYTIVGVAPASFGGTIENDIIELWVPLAQYEPANLIGNRRTRQSWAIGRLAPGVSLAAAQSEAESLLAALRESHPDVYKKMHVRVEPMGENWRGGLRRSNLLLLGASVLLLAVAATNVTGLLLARVLDRRRELAVRAALGAGRGRILRQLLLEALLIVAAGGALGMLVAPSVLRAFLELSPVDFPAYVRVAPDPLALGLSLLVLCGAGLLAGCAPALVGSRVGPAEALKDGGRGAVGGRRERRWGSVMVTCEVALTVMLLVAGGLLLRSWERLQGTSLGYRSEGIVRLAVGVSNQDVRQPADLPAFRDRLRETLLAHPGVERVGLVWPTLPPWDALRARIRFPELPPDLAEEGLNVGTHLVDDGLLSTLDVPIIAGRGLTPADTTLAVAVVSRAVAQRMGGLERALGSELSLVPHDDLGMDASGTFRVVGVSENVGYDGLGMQDTGRYIRYSDPSDAFGQGLDVYLPLGRAPARPLSIAVRVGGDAAAFVEPLRRRIAEVAPTSAVHWTGTMREELAREYAPSRFYAVLVTAFSVSALLLTAVGLFAVLSHGVIRRTGEIGLRVALGARPRHIRALVLRSGLLPLAWGALGGLGGAAALAGLLRGVLHGTAPLDAGAFLGATGVMLLVAVPASLLPARRAGALDPMRALREE
jgi:putative ABC transport system permease protein